MQEREADREARHDVWLKQNHQMGGMNLSGEDLEKLMNFIKNPAMQKLIADRLASKGVDKKTIAKGQSEMNDYIKLKEKESKEGLTKEEQHRLQQINDSKEFKVYAAESVEVARERGIDLSQNKTASIIAAATDEKEENTTAGKASSMALLENSSTSSQTSNVNARGFGVASSARDVSAALASAPDMKAEFDKKSNVLTLASASNFDPEMGASKTVKANAVTMPSKQIAMGDSFGSSMG
jgi:hypothetical protein